MLNETHSKISSFLYSAIELKKGEYTMLYSDKLHVVNAMIKRCNLHITRIHEAMDWSHVNLRDEEETIDISFFFFQDHLDSIEIICMKDGKCVCDTERYLFDDHHHTKTVDVEDVIRRYNEYMSEDHTDDM